MGNLVLPHMAVCGIYIYIYIYISAICSYTGEYIEDFMIRLKKGNVHLGKLTMDMLDSSLMKKTAADSMTKGKQIL